MATKIGAAAATAMLEIGRMGDSELRDLNKRIVEEIRARSREKDRKSLADLDRGSKVWFTGDSRRLPHHAVGTVKSFGSRKVLVDFGRFREWRVPPSMIEIAPQDAKIEPSPFAGGRPFMPVVTTVRPGDREGG